MASDDDFMEQMGPNAERLLMELLIGSGPGTARELFGATIGAIIGDMISEPDATYTGGVDALTQFFDYYIADMHHSLVERNVTARVNISRHRGMLCSLLAGIDEFEENQETILKLFDDRTPVATVDLDSSNGSSRRLNLELAPENIGDYREAIYSRLEELEMLRTGLDSVWKQAVADISFRTTDGGPLQPRGIMPYPTETPDEVIAIEYFECTDCGKHLNFAGLGPVDREELMGELESRLEDGLIDGQFSLVEADMQNQYPVDTTVFVLHGKYLAEKNGSDTVKQLGYDD